MRHEEFSDTGPQRIAISGASGLIGEALSSLLLADGHEVVRLVRREAEGPHEVSWSPDDEQVDWRALEGIDALVHLAGEGIADARWTDDRKQLIRTSRVRGTRALARAVAKLERKPAVMLSASAVGYYGARGNDMLTEASDSGSGFLPSVCRAWEEAADAARDAGVRVVHPRMGVVLSAQGGALARMLPPFRLGVGGVLGDGQQFMSPISLEDAVSALHWLMLGKSATGPINLTLPEPVTNREFTKTLGEVLGRPTLFPLPKFVVKGLFGEMGEHLLLNGQRVIPAKLQQLGYSFLHPTVEDALRFELGRFDAEEESEVLESIDEDDREDDRGVK